MGSERRYGAMRFTVEVLLAAARARAELNRVPTAGYRFEFRLLAAAAQAMPSPPAEGWHDITRQLKVQITTVGDELQIALQAEGYAALQRVAGQAGRLLSPDGALDVRFRAATIRPPCAR